MSRFYIPKESVKGKFIHISGKEAHHIADVMRLKVSDKVVTFDGTGAEYTGFIKEIKPRLVVVEIAETRPPIDKELFKVTLIQAIPKKGKMDYIVEKSTELGASRIIPVVTARTIPDWNESKKASSVERWRKIAMEASKQCGRCDIPEIDHIGDISDFTPGVAGYDLALIAAIDDSAIKLKDALKGFRGGKVVIAIGPEGDFTLDEIEEAKKRGFKLVNLGPRVLKSDTAGLFALSVINYELTN